MNPSSALAPSRPAAARFRVETGQKYLLQLRDSERETAARQAALQSRTAQIEKRLFNTLDILSPADVPLGATERRLRAFAEKFPPEAPSYSFQVNNPSPKGKGLREQRLEQEMNLKRLESEIASYQASLPPEIRNDPKAIEKAEFWRPILGKITDLRAQAEGTKAALKSLDRQIASLQDETTSLSVASQAARSALAAVESELAGLRLQQDFAGSVVAENSLAAYTSSVSADSAAASASALSGASASAPAGTTSAVPAQTSLLDLSIVSPASPARPQVAPQRMVSAIMAGFIGAFLTCLVLAFIHLIEHLPKLGR